MDLIIYFFTLHHIIHHILSYPIDHINQYRRCDIHWCIQYLPWCGNHYGDHSNVTCDIIYWCSHRECK
jgi:hypothetical protein